jgi:protein TonB
VLIEPPDLAAYYPRRARMQGVAGTTRIRLTLAADGRVTEVEVLDSTPPGVFEMAARRVGEALQFRPAVRDGRPVAARVSLNLVWRLE